MNTIELLESRIAPSVTVVVTAGVLHIDHVAGSPKDTLSISQEGFGIFHVTETGITPSDYGVFSNVKTIDVKLGDTDDVVNLQVTEAGLAGTLSIATGAGTNLVSLTTVGGAGRIIGAVRVIGDGGADSLGVGGGLALKSSLTFIGEGGIDHVEADGVVVGKTVFVDNVEDTTFNGVSPVVFGSLNIDQDEAASAVVFILNDVVSVKGKLTYCGTPTFDDNVTLLGAVGGPALLMLDEGTNNVKLAARMNSTLTITGGAGADTILFTDGKTALPDPNLVPNLIANHTKAVKMNLGEGNNTLTLEKSAHFYQSLSLKTGAGNDTINFSGFFAHKDVKLAVGAGTNTVMNIGLSHGIGGTFNYVGGMGADTLDILGIVADKISIVLGNGANGVSGVAQVIGTKATILGGADVDTLNVGFNSSQATFTAKLGDGADSLTYAGGSLEGAVLDGGPGTDTIIGTARLPFKKVIKAFETQTP